jgi:peptidoglycan/xylan/chitin deacetylase (PgdA/CDA1 family)
MYCVALSFCLTRPHISNRSRVDEALIRIAGVNPSFMRPPYGEYNDVVRQVAASRNQVLAIWDYDSDGNRPPTAQSIQGYTDLAARHPLNVLTLNHETNGAFSSIRHYCWPGQNRDK